MSDWKIYKGNQEPHDEIIERLPDPPPWRDFKNQKWKPEAILSEHQKMKSKLSI